MRKSNTARTILSEARVFPRGPNRHVYVIGHEAVGVSVYSQQVRALNLIWAYASLHGRSAAADAPLARRQIVVIGGGIAGLTAAAAADLCGAQVTILERSHQPLGLQIGCHHRFLHPRIYDWPHQKALMARANLPLLDWSVGTADDVARHLIEQFETRRRAKLHCGVQEIGFEERYDRVRFRMGHRHYARACDVVIFAVGFGVEKTVDRLPPRSYWRVDPLDQSPLGRADECRVLIAGEGDGGIIDVLRAILKDFDHGPFVDRGLDMMWDQKFREAVYAIEAEVGATLDNRLRGDAGIANIEECASLINERYLRLLDDFPRVTADVSSYLKDLKRPGVQVTWAGQLATPSNPRGMPFNRLLAWLAHHATLFTYWRAAVRHVDVLPHPGAEGGKYEVSLQPVHASSPRYIYGDLQKARFDDVAIRYGTERALEIGFPRIWNAMKGRSAARAQLARKAATMFFAARRARQAAAGKVRSARLCAELRPPEPVNVARVAREEWPAFRIRLSVRRLRSNVRLVTYHLHPEYRGVRREAQRGLDNAFATWIYTYDDYWVDVELKNRNKVAGGWLSELLLASGHTAGKASMALSRAAAVLRGERYPPLGPRPRPEPFDRLARPEIEDALQQSAAASA